MPKPKQSKRAEKACNEMCRKFYYSIITILRVSACRCACACVSARRSRIYVCVRVCVWASRRFARAQVSARIRGGFPFTHIQRDIWAMAQSRRTVVSPTHYT